MGIAGVDFKEWIKEQEGASFPVYFISGKDHWKKEFFAGLKSTYNSGGKIVDKDLDIVLKDIRYKSLREKKKIVMYEPVSNLKVGDMVAIKEYLKRGYSKHGIFILSIKNWGEKKLVKGHFKNLDKSRVIKFFDLDFPGQVFKEHYINYYIQKEGLVFDCKGTEEFFTRRVMSDTENVVDSIVTLKQFNKEVTKDMVKEYTEDSSTYNYDKLYETIVLLNRVKVPYIAYQDLIDSGRRPSTILINILDYMRLLYQAKYLSVKGILRPYDIIARKKKIYDKGKIKFDSPCIWDESDYKINKLLEQSLKISMQEILYIIEKLEEVVIRDDKGRVAYIPDAQAYKVFLELLDRVCDG